MITQKTLSIGENQYKIQSLPAIAALAYKAKLLKQLALIGNDVTSAGDLRDYFVNKVGGEALGEEIFKQLGSSPLAKKLEPLRGKTFSGAQELITAVTVQMGRELNEKETAQLSEALGKAKFGKDRVSDVLFGNPEQMFGVVTKLSKRLDDLEVQEIFWGVLGRSLIYACELGADGAEKNKASFQAKDDKALDQWFSKKLDEAVILFCECLVFNYSSFLEGLKKKGNWKEIVQRMGIKLESGTPDQND